MITDQRLAKYCSDQTGKTVWISGNYTVITFHSNEFIEKRGFRIRLLPVVSGGKWNLKLSQQKRHSVEMSP